MNSSSVIMASMSPGRGVVGASNVFSSPSNSGIRYGSIMEGQVPPKRASAAGVSTLQPNVSQWDRTQME